MVCTKPRCSRFVLIFSLYTFPAFLLPATAQQKDTLHFFNSAQLVGELLTIRLGRVEFDADGVGIVKIKNKEIKSIYAQSHEYRIETTEGQLLQGYLRPTEKNGHVTVHSLTDSQEMGLADITYLVKYDKNWKHRFSGNVGAGYSYTKSSEIGRLNLDGAVKYTSPKTETKLNVSAILTADSVEFQREREDANLGFNYSLKSLWTAGAAIRYQRNLELGLDRRLQEAIMIGYEFLVRKNQQAFVFTGIAINQERNLEGVEIENAEVVVQGNYELFSFQDPNLTLSVRQTGYFGLSETGRTRYDGDVDLSWELISDFSITFQFYHNYDSQSPETGEPNIDYGFVVGLSLKF